MTETQLYVGCTQVYEGENDPTVAPGQLPYKHDPLTGDCTSDSYSITDLFCKEGIYVYAHSNTCFTSDQLPTPPPTEQGTTTVAKEAESLFDQGDRGD